MSDLQVSEWKRYGQDRLYVNRADGEAVAWFDRRIGHLEVLVDGYRDAALDALAPHVAASPASPPPSALHPPRASLGGPSTLSPEFDLASNRPGEALRVKVRELSPGALGRVLAHLLHRRTEADPWRAGLVGERIVGKELGQLSRHGWRTLHSIPLPRLDADIDHLLIGPGGVFTINTKNHRGAKVWVGDDSARVNGGDPHPYVRKIRREAARVSHVLSERCPFPVQANALLVFVAPATLTKVPTLHDVGVLRDRELAAMTPMTGVLTAAQIETAYAVARDRRSWETA
ncbi:nuclease-related domain-containing protein [Actinacidiphila sp. ITFR-21]|uniref:nuclease-related domain-containing protein n=1 Tax=Actinacidiphila sp. ITFR-21 TaxID=3075199 RepID=UPI00288B38F2|nr:nuclease-related domain-containing protein [Streptomyces sp. ITFR-21]WNI18709.1 nuclease-related domain-containing protein [Streptomyces sp. ITFR-21]